MVFIVILILIVAAGYFYRLNTCGGEFRPSRSQRVMSHGRFAGWKCIDQKWVEQWEHQPQF